MTSKPRRRRRRATPVAAEIVREDSFWGTLATYATELAPVAGPLLDALGQTAHAIDRAGRRHRSLRAEARALPAEWEEESGRG